MPWRDTGAEIGIAIAEAQCLREEITTRITLMNAVVGLELAALGVGLSIVSKPTYVLAALGAASSFLWLLWMDQSLYTYKIASYLAIRLAPRLSQLTGYPVLGWETFLRRIEGNGEMSHRALHPDPSRHARGLLYSGRHAEWYIPMLFVATPPLLLTLYITDTRDSLIRLLSACLATGFMWVYTVIRFVLLIRNIRILNEAISAAEQLSVFASTDKPLCIPQITTAIRAQPEFGHFLSA